MYVDIVWTLFHIIMNRNSASGPLTDGQKRIN